MASKGRVLETIVALSGKVDPQLGKAMGDVQKKLDGVNVKAVAVGAAIGTAIGAGVIKGSKYLAELGDTYNTALNDIQAETGATAAETEALGESLKNVYKAGYGEDMQDVADGLSTVRKNTKLAGEALEEVTEAGFALRDTFGYELTESSRAAKALMTNFGESGAEAMNLIAAGAQNGLDYSGEMIDSINEYSVQFAKLGFTAEDMFKIFQAGADSGAWNLDKVGDAIKEFSIRSIDGSQTSRDAFEALGYDADEMFQVFTKGGDEATGAFHQVINDLMDMDDHVARDAAGVGLFGTMWEDLGTEAMQALADMEAGAYATGDELSTLQALKFDDLDSAFTSIKRNLEVGLLPIASDFANLLVDAAPKIGEGFEAISPIIIGVADVIGPVAGATIDFAIDGIAFLAENADILAPAIAGVTTVLGLYKLASMASAVATGGTTAAMTISTVATGAWTTVSGIATVATTALGAAFTFLTSPIGLIILAIGAVVAAGVLLYKNWDVVKEKAAAVGAFLGEKWTAIKETLGGIVDGIKAKFQTGFATLVGIAKGPVNQVIGMINSVVDKINAAGFTIPDWVPVVGGKGFSVNIPNIPMLAAGGFTDGVSIAGEAGTEAVISFDPRYRAQNLEYWTKAGQMLGADAEGYSLSSGNTSTIIKLGDVNFNPEIIIQGNADKNDIIQAIKETYPEFIDLLEKWLGERGDFVYE